MGHAILERALLLGTRSADHIRASSHSGCIATGVILQAKTGRIHGCTRTLRKTSDSSCTAGAVHTWPIAKDMALQRTLRFPGTAEVSLMPRRSNATALLRSLNDCRMLIASGHMVDAQAVNEIFDGLTVRPLGMLKRQRGANC